MRQRHHPPPGIAPRLRLIYENSGLSRRAFGAPLGLTERHISALFRGTRGLMPGALAQLKLAYNVNIDWLISGEGPMYGSIGFSQGFFRITASATAMTRKAVYEGDAEAQSDLRKCLGDTPPEEVAQILAKYLVHCPQALFVADLYEQAMALHDETQRLESVLVNASEKFAAGRLAQLQK